MRPSILKLSLLASSVAAIATVAAQPEVEARNQEPSEVAGSEMHGDAPPRREETKSRSIGRTNTGRLLHGVALRSSAHLHVRVPRNAHGTQEMVDLLQWAAARVAAHHPGSVLNVGSISRERGGRMRPHRSHRAGRDADVGFYVRNATTGDLTVPPAFVTMGRTGKGTIRDVDYAFDDERNWTFIEALMSQDVVPIQYIMVVIPLRERLIAEGERRGASPELLARVREVVGPRRSGRGRWARYGTHDSHFHIRIYCSEEDRPRCRDAPPYWDWVAIPPEAQVSAMSSMRRRSRSMRAARNGRASRGAMRRRASSMQTTRRRRSRATSMQQ